MLLLLGASAAKITVSSDDWPSEVSWTLACSHGAANVSGGSPFVGSSTAPADATCTLTMYDSFGDGWQGAQWSGFGQSFSLAAGYQTETFVVPQLPPPSSPPPPPAPPASPPWPPSPPSPPLPPELPELLYSFEADDLVWVTNPTDEATGQVNHSALNHSALNHSALNHSALNHSALTGSRSEVSPTASTDASARRLA